MSIPDISYVVTIDGRKCCETDTPSIAVMVLNELIYRLPGRVVAVNVVEVSHAQS